ncbi:MAG: hypothetical protein AAGE01_12910 [Pseudomonadota bacterium]
MTVNWLSKDDPLSYEGPIVDDRAHGFGTCKSKYLDYPCRYHEDHLIEIQGVSLLP